LWISWNVRKLGLYALEMEKLSSCMEGTIHSWQWSPTIILEAVASQDLWIWHAFFGVAGANNDINVINQSPLFTERLQGCDPQVEYYVNGRKYNIGYYLTDGIYPQRATFVKSIKEPQTVKDKLYAERQEGARKDVERAFGVLKQRFKIVVEPSCLGTKQIFQT